MIALRMWLDFANAAWRRAFDELPERLAGHSYSVDYLPADTAASHADKPGATTDLSIGVDPDALSRWACACRFETASAMPPARWAAMPMRRCRESSGAARFSEARMH